MLRFAHALAAVCLLTFPTTLFGSTVDTELLTDPGFEPSGPPLASFFDSVLDQWAAESADLVAGTQNGLSPLLGSGMLRIAPSGGVVSQTRQRVDVSTCSALFAAGTLKAQAVAKMNASVPGTQARVRISALDSSQELEVTSRTKSLDSDLDTWESLAIAIVIPAGCLFLEIQVSYVNASLPGAVGYCDEASLIMTECPLGFQTLTDSGFEPGSDELVGYGTGLTGRWGVESGSYVIGTQLGVSPLVGDGMIELTSTGGSLSQLRQRVAIDSCAGTYADGTIKAEARIRMNASVGGVSARLAVRALDDSTVLMSNSLDVDLDADPSTWELIELEVIVPVGATFIEIEPAFFNATLPSNEAGYCDQASLVLTECPPESQTTFVRGDGNDDGSVNIADVVFCANALFVAGAPTPDCLDAMDANDDGAFNVADCIFLASALFATGAPAPSAPHPDCGVDPTVDSLDCEIYNSCP